MDSTPKRLRAIIDISRIYFISKFYKVNKRTAENTYIQVHPPNQQVKILEYNDAINMKFDHLWLSGLDNHVWPNKHKHYSLFHVNYRIRYNFPQSTPNKSAEHEEKILNTLIGSSKNVVFELCPFKRMRCNSLLPIQ